MKIDPSHPRATSLKIREKLVWGVKKGFTSIAGLTAHGRGEAFDYLLGEKTQEFAKKAVWVAAAFLLRAKKPILSINGNCTALVSNEYIKLAKLLHCKIEVNLFHYTKKRSERIELFLKHKASDLILLSSRQPKIVLPKVGSFRKVVLRNGIGISDVVFIPLEDGDRCQALIDAEKKVITVDLNPLSRTAQSATVTIIDNVTRAMPLLVDAVNGLKNSSYKELDAIIVNYDNAKTLFQSLQFIKTRLTSLASKRRECYDKIT